MGDDHAGDNKNSFIIIIVGGLRIRKTIGDVVFFARASLGVGG